MCKRDLPSKDGEALSEVSESLSSANSNKILRGSSKSSLQWFVAYTTPRHEKHVAELLAERQIETFLPLYTAARQWKKSSPVALQLPLFPTYVFVRMVRSERSVVLGVSGVLSIVGSAREQWPLPDGEIETLRLSLHMRKVEPHPYLKVGERVRIKAGLMAGVEGILVREKDECRVILTLDMIMRSVAVEVDASDIESAGKPSYVLRQDSGKDEKHRIENVSVSI